MVHLNPSYRNFPVKCSVHAHIALRGGAPYSFFLFLLRRLSKINFCLLLSIFILVIHIKYGIGVLQNLVSHSLHLYFIGLDIALLPFHLLMLGYHLGKFALKLAVVAVSAEAQSFDEFLSFFVSGRNFSFKVVILFLLLIGGLLGHLNYKVILL